MTTLPSYALITAARNEAALIRLTLDSVVSQTVRPMAWVIVDDGSTDRISFGPDHFEFLLVKFAEDRKLGLAGTAYTQEGWESTRDSLEGETSVHGACHASTGGSKWQS